LVQLYPKTVNCLKQYEIIPAEYKTRNSSFLNITNPIQKSSLSQLFAIKKKGVKLHLQNYTGLGITETSERSKKINYERKVFFLTKTWIPEEMVDLRFASKQLDNGNPVIKRKTFLSSIIFIELPFFSPFGRCHYFFVLLSIF